MKPKRLSVDDLEMLWIGSFRYYLGRMTISTHSYCDALMRNWSSIPERGRYVIERDLLEEIKRDDLDRVSGSEHKALGHDCDSQKWREVLKVVGTPRF